MDQSNIYYEESDYDYDEDKYDADDYYDTQSFEEWLLDLERSYAESQKKQNELLIEFHNRQAESHEELSKKIDRGFIRMQKDVDTTISNVEHSLNNRTQKNDIRHD